MNVVSSNGKPAEAGTLRRRFHGWHLMTAALLILFLLINLLTLSSPIFRDNNRSLTIVDLPLLAENPDAELPEEAEEAALPEEELESEEGAEEAEAPVDEPVEEPVDEPESVVEFTALENASSLLSYKQIIFWIDLAVIVFLLLQLLGFIPWHKLLDLPVSLAVVAAFVLSCIILFSATSIGLGLKFSGVLWFGAILIACALAAFMAVYLLRQTPDKLVPINDVEFLALPNGDKKCYRVGSRFASIPGGVWNGVKGIGRGIKKAALAVVNECKDIVTTFINGDWKTKLSYVVMGFGNIARGQILRGVLFLLFEAVFIFYMIFSGGKAISLLFRPILGEKEQHIEKVMNQFGTGYTDKLVPGDDSFKVMLYGVLALFFVLAFIYTWRTNIKQNKIAEEILKTGKPLKSGKDDLRSMVDDNFHRTLLALPMTGIIVFTVMPIFFMVLIAFTNYSYEHNGIAPLFGWQGLAGFREMLSWNSGGINYSAAFGEILTWTLIWAVFATFTNYFLGIFVAMMINKKGIKFKKLWRTVLILTIAIPQFISLLFVSQMFAKNGIVNGTLIDLGFIKYGQEIPFWEDKTLARVMVIIINIWIGIPYLMLIATGILMNIPADLYESSRIDGASGWKQFSKITLPYMLFITGPYLLTSFTGNMNNFNVIYLLTGGNPVMKGVPKAGHTDLLITWLFKLTTGENQRPYLASVIGILVFLVVSVITLVVYGLLPSVKNEEDFQ